MDALAQNNELIHITELDVRKLIFIIQNGFLESEEVDIAEKLKAIANSNSFRSKYLISKHLSRSIKIPRDIALKLSYDHFKIAYNILLNSPLLNDSDLYNIIKDTRDINRVRTISKRTSLSTKLIELILSFGDAISEEAIKKNHITQVSSSVEKKSDFNFSPLKFFEMDISLILKSKEYSESYNIINSIKNINYSLLIRYLCKADLLSFFIILSRLTNTPISNLRKIFSNPTQIAEQTSLLQEANAPKEYISLMIDFIKILVLDSNKITENNFKNYITNKLSRHNYNNRQLNYILGLLQ